MFSVICAHQLEPAVDTLMASAHSIRLMAHNDHYAAILGDDQLILLLVSL